MRELGPLVPRNNNETKITITGSGHLFGFAALGFTAGACLAAAVIVAMWTGSTLARYEKVNADQDAFIQATYQIAPQIRDEFNRIKTEQEATRVDHNDHHPAAPASASAAAGAAESESGRH